MTKKDQLGLTSNKTAQSSEQFAARRGQGRVRRSLEEISQECEQCWPG